jgi:hypothetical protein
MDPHALDPFERRLTPCAEFPNDNEDLHYGSIWVCVELGRDLGCEPPRSRPMAAPRMAAPLEDGPRDVRPGLASVTDPPADPTEIVSMLTIPRVEDAPVDAPPADPTAAPAVDPTEIVSMLTIQGLEEGSEAGAEGVCDVQPLGDQLETEWLGEDAEPIEIVDELSFDDAVDDGLVAAEPARSTEEPGASDPFTRLVSSLEEVVRGLGAGDEGIACLAALFGQTRLDGFNPGERAAEALVAAGVVARGARGFSRSQTFTATVLAWQGILRGESEDFSLPDGGALEPLDEWAADLLARIVGLPGREEGIRRDLRRRGIAAFGLVAEAA